MHRQTEDMGTYAWRRTIYSTPGKMIPWWQLPIEETEYYFYEDYGKHSVKISLTTAEGNKYTSLVSTDRAISLLTQMQAVVSNKEATEILRQCQAIADRTSPH